MSITYNLPISEWYYDETSEWTLDYPPLFAIFEFVLAVVAHFLGFDEALVLTKSKIRTESVIAFQRASVIVSDFLYYYATYRLCKALDPLINRADTKNLKSATDCSTGSQISKAQTLFDALYDPDNTSKISLLLLFQPGLLLVDHIHFQYNGLLSGILLLSMANIIEKNYVSGSFWFAILLNFKHIYLYCSPAFGMYLLTSYCLAKSQTENRIFSFIKRCFFLSITVLTVFAITFCPFSDQNTLIQISSRLFPFKRGLTHAYWAPNVWSLYNTADKILANVYKDSLPVKFDIDSISRTKPISSTSGLVMEYEHQYLPSIRPLTTFALVALCTIPLSLKFLFTSKESRPSLFMKAVTLSAFTSFMFGWHVHEKAIILVLLPLIPASFMDKNLTNVFLRLTLAGTYSLFPLIFEPAEYLLKLTLLITYFGYAKTYCSLKSSQHIQPADSKTCRMHWLWRIWWISCKWIDQIFIVSIFVIEMYITLIHGRFNYGWNPMAKLNRFEFLPLMLTSSISALGITFSYFELYHAFVFGADELADGF